ncbi:receptor kinase 3 [Prunus dulcis]|uniref:Receptor kinase 3 n=1 Tax=Prunus dulcis TaxID=3755 RepID=A0A4Y1RNC7_PRUDU|nr:receptor kinase 3 [Prunus dulcis]
MILNFITPMDEILLTGRSEEEAIDDSMASSIQSAASVSNMADRLRARANEVQKLTTENSSLQRMLHESQQEVEKLKGENNALLKLVIEVGDYSNWRAPSFFEKPLSFMWKRHFLPEDKILEFTIDKEAWKKLELLWWLYMSMVGFIDPATVSANSGTVAERSRLVAARLQKTDGEQIFMMPYNPAYKLTTSPSLDLADCKSKEGDRLFFGSSARSSCGRRGGEKHRTPKQPSSVECGYYVMRFMRDIIMDPSLGFENMYAKGNQEASYPQEAIDEVRNEWAETVFQFIK